MYFTCQYYWFCWEFYPFRFCKRAEINKTKPANYCCIMSLKLRASTTILAEMNFLSIGFILALRPTQIYLRLAKTFVSLLLHLLLRAENRLSAFNASVNYLNVSSCILLQVLDTVSTQFLLLIVHYIWRK